MNSNNNGNRNLLIGIAAVGALCLCAGIAGFFVLRELGTRVTQSFKTDPTEVSKISGKIAQFDIPAGYKASMAMSLLNYDTVILSPSNGQTDEMIMLMQMNGVAAPDPAQMQRTLEQQSGQSGNNTKVVDSYVTTIRGEQTTVTVQESDSSQGYVLRQLIAIFKGNNGAAILMIQGNKNTWDQNLADQFIASIR
jgi:hypothetical protein